MQVNIEILENGSWNVTTRKAFVFRLSNFYPRFSSFHALISFVACSLTLATCHEAISVIVARVVSPVLDLVLHECILFLLHLF